MFYALYIVAFSVMTIELKKNECFYLLILHLEGDGKFIVLVLRKLDTRSVLGEVAWMTNLDDQGSRVTASCVWLYHNFTIFVIDDWGLLKEIRQLTRKNGSILQFLVECL